MNRSRADCGAFTGARRGGTLVSWLLTLSILSAFGVTAAMVTPGFLHGSGTLAPTGLAARSPDHQALIDALGALIGRSPKVLAIHDRGPTPYMEVLLWVDDAKNPGTIDGDELALLSHSRVLQTITYYTLAEGGDAARYRRGVDQLGPAFCTQWRAEPDVMARMIGAGVSDMRVEPVEGGPTGPALLRISLTWGPDSTDGPDEASVLVDAAYGHGGQE